MHNSENLLLLNNLTKTVIALRNAKRKSNNMKVFRKKGSSKNFVKFKRKHLCQLLFLINSQVYSLKVFSCKLCKIFKNNFFRNTSTSTNFIQKGWFQPEKIFSLLNNFSIYNIRNIKRKIGMPLEIFFKPLQRWIQRFWKGGGALCRPP